MINEGKVFNPFYIGSPKKLKYARITSPFNERSVQKGNLAVHRQLIASKKRLAMDRRIRAGGKSVKSPFKPRTMATKPFKTEMPRNGLYVPSEMAQPSYLSLRPSSYSQSSASMLRLSQVSSRSRRHTHSSDTIRASRAVRAGGGDRKARDLRSQAGGNRAETRSRTSDYSRASRRTADDISRSSLKSKRSDHRAHNYSVSAMEIYPSGRKNSGWTKSNRIAKVTTSLKDVANSVRRQLAESVKASKLMAASADELTKCLKTLLSN